MAWTARSPLNKRWAAAGRQHSAYTSAGSRRYVSARWADLMTEAVAASQRRSETRRPSWKRTGFLDRPSANFPAVAQLSCRDRAARARSLLRPTTTVMTWKWGANTDTLHHPALLKSAGRVLHQSVGIATHHQYGQTLAPWWSRFACSAKTRLICIIY